MFGTDGIRGTYGTTLNDSTAYLLGRSLTLLCDCPVIAVARDTRLSGENLFYALCRGIYDGGGNVINFGILPTGAVSVLLRKIGCDFGVMISASHNPPCDNGLKVFDKYGVKPCKTLRGKIEEAMQSLSAPSSIGKIVEPLFPSAEKMYLDSITSRLSVDLHGMKIALDCAFGASFAAAPQLFGTLGAEVTAFNAVSDGSRINDGCGAIFPQFCEQNAREFPLAFAFDGDADRLAVFERGQFIDGNAVLFAIAKYLHSRKTLTSNAVVGTVLTNGGVEKALSQLGLSLCRSAVGDSNVLEKMAEVSTNFGGEESGHYVFTDYASTADALVSALVVCKIFKKEGSVLSYCRQYVPEPNRRADVDGFAAEDDLIAIKRRIETLCPNCRVVLRQSGTESKVRAYVEGSSCGEALSLLLKALQSVIRTH